MKGNLTNVNNQWMVRFFDGYTSKTIHLHPSEKHNPMIPLNEGSEVEFDIYDGIEEINGVDCFAKILIPHNF
jgi:hypothetical protein